MQFTSTDQVYLIHAAKAGNRDAMAALLDQHHELIEWVAGRYAGSGATRRQNMEDLRQDARLAFMKAVKNFKLDAPNLLKTYACRSMENECKDAAPRYFFPYTIPSRSNDQRMRCRRAEREMQERLRREPTAAEIGREVGMSAREVEECMTLPRVTELDRPLPSAHHGVDRLFPEIPVTDEQEIGIRLWRALLTPCVASLPADEREVIDRAFGLTVPEVPQQQLAAERGVNAMAITRLKHRALLRLREMIGGVD